MSLTPSCYFKNVSVANVACIISLITRFILIQIRSEILLPLSPWVSTKMCIFLTTFASLLSCLLQRLKISFLCYILISNSICLNLNDDYQILFTTVGQNVHIISHEFGINILIYRPYALIWNNWPFFSPLHYLSIAPATGSLHPWKIPLSLASMRTSFFSYLCSGWTLIGSDWSRILNLTFSLNTFEWRKKPWKEPKLVFRVLETS